MRSASAITAEPYTLLHVVCHGQLLRDGPHQGETVLYLGSAAGGLAPVSGSEFIKRVAELGGARGLPRLAFLCACESASAEAEGALGGLAQRLVRELGMPAVVAMSDRVSITTAEALASVFYVRLREHGEVDRALVEAYAGLADRPDATVPALYSRLGSIPLFSDSLDRPLTAAEIDDGLQQLTDLLPMRAPVLQPPFAALAGMVQGGLATASGALSADVIAQRVKALNEIAALSLEATDVSFAGLALGESPPAYDGRQPFRGLYAFRAEDHEFFFGREDLVRRLTERLTEHPFLAVLGPSGSGKSSVVLGGLLPALGTSFAVLTPGADPVAQLAAALAGADPGALVVVDQFEEVFTQCSDEAMRSQFIAQLLTLVPGRRVVVTMRADFWGDCAPYPALRETMQAHQQLIAPMDPSELRRAMDGQAGAVGLKFEADLAHTLLDEVSGEPGAMPLLQQALLELWKRRHGRWLLTSEYRTLGGVKEAIAHTADDLYDTLDPADKDRVRDIFARLTRLDDPNVDGGMSRDTRRRVAASELVQAGADPGPINALIARLADARLVVTSRDAVTGEDEVEVVHEALIRYWPRLRQWLDEGRANLRLRDDIRESALAWEASNRDDALLVHRGGRLDDAVALSKQPRFGLNVLEQTYLDGAVALRAREQQHELEQATALAEQQRERAEAEGRARTVAERSARRQRYFSLGLAALLVVSIATGGYAFLQRQAADTQRQKTLSDGLAAEAIGIAREHPDIAQLLAVQAYKIRDTTESRSGLLAATQCCTDGLVAFLGDHTNTLWDVAFSPDGRMLASAGDEGTIRIWDVAARRLVRLIGNSLSTATIYTVAFSPTQHLLAAGDSEGRIILYDTDTWQPLMTLSGGHSFGVFSLKYSQDGHTLVSGGKDGKVIVWNVWDGQHVTNRVLTTETSQGKIVWVYDVAVSADGMTVASVSNDTVLRLWDLRLAQSTPTSSPPSKAGNLLNVAFDEDPRHPVLLTAGTAGKIVVWDLRPFLASHDDPVRSLVRDPTLRTTDYMWGLAVVPWLGELPRGDPSVVIAQNLGTIQRSRIVFDVAQNAIGLESQSPEETGNAVGVYRIDVSPDGQLIAAAGRDGLVSLWRVDESSVVVRHAAPLSSLRVVTGTTSVVSVDVLGHLLGWDVRTPIVTSRIQLDVARSLEDDHHFLSVISPDGSRVVTANDAGLLTLLDAHNGNRLAEVSERASPAVPSFTPTRISSIAISPDGDTVATGDTQGRILLWDISQDRLEVPVVTLFRPTASAITALAFSPDGRKLVVGDCAAQIKSDNPGCEQAAIGVLDAHTLALQAHGTGPSGWVRSLAFRPGSDDSKVAVGAEDGTVGILDLTGDLFAVFVKVGVQDVTAIAYSADGAQLAFGVGNPSTHEHSVYVYDAATLQPVGRRFEDHDEANVALTFSSDGGYLLSGSLDRTVAIHDMQPQDWVARACRIANRNLTREEWSRYVGRDVPYEATCPEFASGQ